MTDLSEIKKLQQAREKVWSSISDYEQRARNHRTESESFLIKLANKTSEFINSGVAVIGRYENDEWSRVIGDTLYKYLKDINVSLDRPFIFLQESEDYYVQRWVLNVPKSPSRLKNIAAGLLMVAETYEYPGSHREEGVMHAPHQRKWEFHFIGKKGREFKDEWLRNCKEDPIFRLCLGLPLKVS